MQLLQRVLKISVLSSGSKGNATFVASPTTNILIDLGTSSLYTEKSLKELEVDPKEINGIIITHLHTDHINGLAVFIKKYNTKVYLTQKMFQELILSVNLNNFEIIQDEFIIGDIFITALKTSHDVTDSNGYIIEYGDKSIVYITDTGYIHEKYHLKLENRSMYIMESNHDINLLMNGEKPYPTKQRVLGDVGHLSNLDSANYLSKFIGKDTKNIVLAHLSEKDNDPEIALNNLISTLTKNNKEVVNIIVAKQNIKTEMIEI
ncbi:MAG: MBL fold metallo-hydrolase [Bacilli bacterium]